MKLHIVLVTHYFPSHGGGLERVAWEIAKRWLSDNNTQMDWFSSNTDLPPPQINGLTTHSVCAWNGLEAPYGVPFPLWSLKVLPKLWQTIRQADVVHIHDSLYMGNVIAAIFAWLLKKRLILTQHIGFVPYKSRLLRILLSIANQTLARFVMALSDEVVFISATVEDYFRSLWTWKKKPKFIANGVDTEVYYPPTSIERESVRKQLQLTSAKPIFLFVGRFVEKKGLLLLKQMAAATPDVDWIFAGRGALNPNHWNLPNVKVFSGLAEETLRPLYWAADLLVLPSVGEGFPLVVQEASACGLPAMVDIETAKAYPDVQSLLFTEKATGENVSERWVTRLQEICADKNTLLSLKQSLALFAKQHWSWEQCVNRYKLLAFNIIENG